MKLILILSVLIAIEARLLIRKKCTGIKINGLVYDNETLRVDIDRPFLLAVDYSTNDLYLSYNIVEDDAVYKSAKLNLDTKDYITIEDVTNGFAQTVDQQTHQVYIGGSDGIYKYDHSNNKAEIIGERGSEIWTLYFRDVLYYSVFPAQFIYTLVDGKSTKFLDLENTKVNNFVIDNEDVMFFTNDTGLYSQKKGTKDAVLFKESPVFRALATDINGKAYACLQDGIYAINKSNRSLDKIVTVNDGFGLTFDKDNNIVYSEGDKLFRLKINRHKRC